MTLCPGRRSGDATLPSRFREICAARAARARDDSELACAHAPISENAIPSSSFRRNPEIVQFGKSVIARLQNLYPMHAFINISRRIPCFTLGELIARQTTAAAVRRGGFPEARAKVLALSLHGRPQGKLVLLTRGWNGRHE